MIIVGCDFHPGWQQVAVFDSSTGEIRERKLTNGNGEAEQFYRSLSSPALWNPQRQSTPGSLRTINDVSASITAKARAFSARSVSKQRMQTLFPTLSRGFVATA